MAGVEAMKQKNLESSILFMQQEHTTTLKGLHEEIHKLQQRCSELTFQLAMEQTSTPQETLYKEKVSALQDQDASLKSVQDQLKKRDIRVQNLEQQIKALDRKYKDELRHKQQNIVKLEAELREKCTELASLRMTVLTARTAAAAATNSTTQKMGGGLTASVQEPYVHSSSTEAMKQRKTSSPRPLSSSSSRESSFSGQGSVTSDNFDLGARQPVPPVGGSKGSKLRKSRHMREPLAEAKLRPASGRKLDVRTSQYQEPLPDNREILQIVAQQKQSLVDLRHGPGTVVPPIAPHNPPSSTARKLSPRSANSAAFAKRVHRVRQPDKKTRENSSSPEIEVETLAVGQVINSDLRKAHEFNSFGTDA